jgi:hypothetical protein
MASIILILTFCLGFFSSTPKILESTKVTLGSLVYFFGSAALCYVGVNWLIGIAQARYAERLVFYLNIGASAMGITFLLHVSFGFLIVFLFWRTHRHEIPSMKQILTRIRTRLGLKSKNSLFIPGMVNIL